jgi:hypothetical protein
MGFYVICGLPEGQDIWAHAVRHGHFSRFSRLRLRGDGTPPVRGTLHLSGRSVWVHDFDLLPPEAHRAGVRGRVVQAWDGAPAGDVVVELAGTPFSSRTAPDGSFELTNLPSGPARLLLHQAATDVLSRWVQLVEGLTVELPPEPLILRRPSAELEPVVVQGMPLRSPLAEFEARRERGAGSFITREEFTKQGNPRTATDVLRRMAGVRVEPSSHPDREWIISLRRGGPRSFGFAAGGNASQSGAGCPPLLFLDRQYIGDASATDIDRAISMEDLEAVEAYGSIATLPSEFNRRGATCGVILFWTRYAQPPTVPVETPSPSFLNSTGFHFLLAVAAVVGIFFGIGEAVHF